MRVWTDIKKTFFCSLLVFIGFLCPSNSHSQNIDKEKVEYLLDQFQFYEYLDWDTAKLYLDSALDLSKGTKDLMLLGQLELYQGWYYQDISNFDQSREHFFNSLEYYCKANSYNKVADVYGNLGNAYHDIGDLKTSLDYQIKSLETNESIILMSKDQVAIDKAIRGRAYCWSNISTIYKTLGQFSRALEYERKALKYELAGTDSIGMGISYGNLGTTFDDLDMMDSALIYTQKAHDIFKSFHFSNGLISTNLALYKFGLAKNKGELKYLLDAYDVTVEFEDVYSQGYVLGYLISGDFGFSLDSTNRMIERGRRIIEDNSFESSLYRFNLDEAKFKERIGDYKGAFHALSRYTTLYSERKTKNETVDYRTTELRHEFEMKSIQDSLDFEHTLQQQEIEREKQIGKQRVILSVTILGGLVLGVILIFVYRSLKVKKKNNVRLSEKNALIEKQKEIVEEKNQEITDSINYARRLQSAILPSPHDLEKELNEVFILFKPKDVVSGDFYWFEKKKDSILIAAADCTGHGVPGAMVSVVCSNALNRAVNEFNLLDPADILNKTRDLVVETFAKSGEDVKDGMDISLCVIHKKSKSIAFSGANNPLWIKRNESNEIEEIKANKQPVGLYEDMTPFQTQHLKYEVGDELFLFTDGFADQFGGEKGKKLKYKPFKQLLLDASTLKHEEKEAKLMTDFENWKGDYEQIDDVCLIGIKM